MKILIIILMSFTPFVVNAQQTSLKITPSFNADYTCIQIHFSPVISDTTKIYTVYDVYHRYWNDSEEHYRDIAAHSSKWCNCPKCVDVRVRLYGKDYDFTFEEFTKIVYPK